MALTDADWAGLCALTETNHPEEQLYVLWVIRNRVESGRFPNNFEGVVLQPMQFSAFNRWTKNGVQHPPEAIFDLVAAREDNNLSDLLAAVHLAEEVLATDDDTTENPFTALDRPPSVEWLRTGVGDPGERVDVKAICHYWSPVSMKPPGSRPPWAPSAKRLFTPPGIDPERFIFAEGVP